MASTESGRRRFLEVVLGSGAAALCTAAIAPPIAFVVASARRGPHGERWVRTVALDHLRDDEPARVKVIADERDAWKLEKNAELGSVWLVRAGDGVRAYAVACPHLGCSIDVARNAKGFECPCHDSSFDENGKRAGGPSPRDMDTLETRVEGGIVEVDFRRFKRGTAERVEIG
jgi:Rieske Fe-S protein